MTVNTGTGLTMRLIDYEQPPQHPIECMGFEAEVSTRQFQGRTKFSIYKRDLDVFLDELDAMVAGLSNTAFVRAGWGGSVFFELRAQQVDKLGHIAVELELADQGPRERMRRLLVEFQTEPALLEYFSKGLRRAAEAGEPTSACLTGVDA